MKIILYCILFLVIILTIILIKSINIYKEKINNLKQIDKETEEKNKKIKGYHTLLKQEIELSLLKYDKIKEKIEHSNSELDRLQQNITNSQNIAKRAYEKYCEALDELYNNKDIETEECIKILDKAYEKKQEELTLSYIETKDKLNNEVASIQENLNKLAQTRAAAIEAQRKEKIVKENKDNFRLNISDAQKSDVLVLERVKKELSNPRILSMLIWQNYFRDYMTELCNNILGKEIICGIYKITNQITEECYIGQSVDVRKKMERSC